MTCFPICGLRSVVALPGAKLFELLESGFLCSGEMADVTFQSRFGIGSFWGGRAHGGTLFIASSVHIVLLSEIMSMVS